MNKKRLKLSTISLFVMTILTIVALTTVVYSWFSTENAAKSASFDILQINSVVTLYEGVDSNFNGVPDKLDDSYVDYYYQNGNAYKYDSKFTYYTEKYTFKYVDQKCALSADSSATLLNTLTIEDAAPSKIYTFKYQIVNYSGFENTIVFGFESDSKVSASILSNFEARLCRLEQNQTVTQDSDNNLYYYFSDWYDFVADGSTTYTAFEMSTSADGMTIPSWCGMKPYGRSDIWLQIRVKDTCTTTFEDFSFPTYRITLSQKSSD